MRIIAGTYRGRTIATLRGLAVRPTGERLRQSLFDVLGDSVRDAVFVDCYAGSGAVGFEALSRGAGQVFLIEESEAAQRLITRNLEAFGFPPNIQLVRGTARKGLRRLEEEGVRVRYCFVDPPYGSSKERDRTLRWLAPSEVMEDGGGAIIVQHDNKDAPPASFHAWTRTRILVQGSNSLSLYSREESEPRT